MKLSIVQPVLNSHEVVRRQLLHFDKIGIPDDTEVIIVDDGSDPAIKVEPRPWLRLIQTYDKRPWTSSLARNTTAPKSRGEYIIFADLDHIVTKEMIDLVRNFDGDFVRFNREFAIIDEEGNVSQDFQVLREYGLSEERINTHGTYLNVHRNQYATRKDFFINVMGGYNERLILTKPYPQREDGDFSKRWDRMHEAGMVRDFDDLVGYEHRVPILMFPSGKYCEGGDVDSDPKGLFHTLTRKTKRNPYYKP